MSAKVRSTLLSLLRRLVGDRNGSIAILAGLTIILLFMAAGAAIDFGRAISVRSAIGRALDASTLAGARLLSTSLATQAQVEKEVSDYFDANIASLGFSDVELSELHVQIDPANGKLVVDGSADVPTYFIRIAGIQTLTVGTLAESTYSSFDVEVSMVLDLSGSMRSYVGDLKTAVTSLLNILLPTDKEPSESKVRIALVPYAQGVRLSTTNANKITDNYVNTSGCVTERDGPNKYTDAYYSTDNDGKYDVGEFGGGSQQSKSGSKCPSTLLQPLTEDRAKLDQIVSNMAVATYTAGHTGINWGWFTLSPNWSSLFSGSSAPASYEDDDTLKFAILMTDGVFNTSYSWKTNACDQYGSAAGYYTYPKYDCWAEAIESDDSAIAGPTRAKALCDGMKAKGIKIYSIAFNLNETTSGKKAKDTMKYCSSGIGYFFDAQSTAQLIAAFTTIANKIQSIFLSL
ncbi:pilus assembly protein [Stappia sp. F7233]|uniref:Pilus assembly protein n=1 Tax=Stappia albiluteola TaxID=2758565 RepID=A0A839AJ42_9HYPH|nr:TadE/TadG family type IV pilus assembly protein [Stappia albiluteola]MBA5778932.1 pilus assembly protein [Stappia albiluteola]